MNGRPGASGPTAASRSAGTPASRKLPNESMKRTVVSSPPSRATGAGKASGTSDSIATVRPTSSNRRPAARCPATGAKMSRPWNVEVVRGSIRSRFSRTRASTAPPRTAAAGRRTPLSGPMRTSPRADRIAIGRRSVPTPGIHDDDVDADRQPRDGGPEQVGAVADRVLPDAVADVDDLGVAGDREHHAAADRRGGFRAEVGEEADDGSVHGPRWYRSSRESEAAPGGERAPLRMGCRPAGGGPAVGGCGRA